MSVHVPGLWEGWGPGSFLINPTCPSRLQVGVPSPEGSLGPPCPPAPSWPVTACLHRLIPLSLGQRRLLCVPGPSVRRGACRCSSSV